MQMTQALDDLLCQRYPALYADRHSDKQSTSMCWGFEHGDGWFAIVDALSETLTDQASTASVPCPAAQQVKQKVGSLRFRVEVPAPGRHAIALAEEMSRRVCEVSGRPGRLTCFGRGRLATLAPGVEPGGTLNGQEVVAVVPEADPLTGKMDVPPLTFGAGRHGPVAGRRVGRAGGRPCWLARPCRCGAACGATGETASQTRKHPAHLAG